MTIWAVPWIAVALLIAQCAERRGFNWLGALAGGLLIGPRFAMGVAALTDDDTCP